MNEAGTFLYVGEFIGCTLFCVLFVFRSHGWWRTRMGPNLFAMMFVLAVLQALSLVRLVVARDWFMEHQVVIRFWSFLALFIVVWWRVILLLRIQHEDRVQHMQPVESTQRVVVEGENQRVILEDTDPDLLKGEGVHDH